ncbi:protein kinase domain-containing protein, partial [Saccharothrix sp. ST-888]|uniref:protein kinase domain-containing protein n=1 Tax=Saccharothrix sp. ST-888 TaxID=1427391 RepID=UPI0005ECA4C5
QTGMVVGTPQYLSPEHALGKSVDARSDLYSVGCILFELVPGRLPFDGDTSFWIEYKRVQEEHPAPSKRNGAVSRVVDELVASVPRKEAANRLPSTHAMRTEVERDRYGSRWAGGALQATRPLV